MVRYHALHSHRKKRVNVAGKLGGVTVQVVVRPGAPS